MKYKGSTSFFCMCISHFLNTICWKDCLSPIEWSCYSHRKSFDHVCEDVLMSLFYSIGLYFCLYASTLQFWLLCLFSKFWNKEVWVLQICSFFLTLFWLFWEPCKCAWNIGLFFSFYKKKSLWDLIVIVLNLQVTLNNIDIQATLLSRPWTHTSFHLLTLSLFSFSKIL